MKTIFSLSIVMLVLFGLSCSNSTQSDKNSAYLSGKVYAVAGNNQIVVLSNALLTARGYYSQTYSGSDGSYRLPVDLGTATEDQDITVDASKAGFEGSSITVVARKGNTTQVPDLTLLPVVSDTSGQDTTVILPGQPSGDAAHIEVYGQHPNHIYVMGTGLAETARIQFVIKDAAGIPVDAAHKAMVHFDVLEGPGGGEYVSPDTMTTADGIVSTVLNSGISSGPVQLQASISSQGKTVWAVPVRITIFGGLPDESHFSLAAEQLNIAGLKFRGIIDRVTAFVGDRYGNPVAPGTAVYFSSDYGIVDGSAITDNLGRATIQFVTADPLPPNPMDSAFVHVYGWTYSDTVLSKAIRKYSRILLTGSTSPITVTPSDFTYSNSNTPVSFEYTISDLWGRPLIADSKVNVSATAGSVYGDTDILLQDTQVEGSGTTRFRFTWAPGDSLEAPEVYLYIKVTTPDNGNGYQSATIVGVKQ